MEQEEWSGNSHLGCGSGMLLGAGIEKAQFPVLGLVIEGTIGTAIGCTA